MTWDRAVGGKINFPDVSDIFTIASGVDEIAEKITDHFKLLGGSLSLEVSNEYQVVMTWKVNHWEVTVVQYAGKE